jgi:DNA-binding NarL/FixJ family response regulator
MEVLGEAANGAEALALARLHRPTVVLMDIRMPVVDGIQATAQITVDPATPDVRVLILTTFDLDEYVYEAVRAGASGFLLKDVRPAELVDAIRVVANGNALLAPTALERLLARFSVAETDRDGSAATDLLTDREAEILRLIASGLSNAEIAASLVVSETTVKTHVSNLLRKLGVRDRVQAVIAAYDAGVVQPRPR